VPVKFGKEHYDNALDECLERISKVTGIKSVYQFGSVKHPGISDLDIMVVAEDNTNIDFDISNIRSANSSYIFKHGPFAVTKSAAENIVTQSFTTNLRLLYGEDILGNLKAAGAGNTSGNQIALEYLLRAYISITLQLKSEIIRARSSLLNLAALKYDFRLLGLNDTEDICTIIGEVGYLKENWFEIKKPGEKLIELVLKTRNSLEVFLLSKFRNGEFFHNVKSSVRLSRRIKLKLKANISRIEKCIKIPLFRNAVVCTFYLPEINNEIPADVISRFSFLREAEKYYAHYLPGFLIPGKIIEIY